MGLWPRSLSSRDVASYYDSWHDRYVQGFGQTFQSQRTDDLSNLFRHIAEAADLSPGMRVLDAGCGVGGPASWLAEEKDVEVHAITISDKQTQEAIRHLVERGLEDRVQVSLGDFHELESHYPTDFFDAVLFLESFVHSRHPELVLQSVARVLRPGGVLYIKDLFRRPRIPDRKERHRVRRVVRNVNRFFCLEVQSQSRILKALATAGFELVWFRDMPIPTNHDMGNAFVAANGIDIYEGEPVTFLDWLELKARRH